MLDVWCIMLGTSYTDRRQYYCYIMERQKVKKKNVSRYLKQIILYSKEKVQISRRKKIVPRLILLSRTTPFRNSKNDGCHIFEHISLYRN